MTKFKVYEAFTEQYFKREAYKTRNNVNVKIPVGFEFESSYSEFSRDLAINMWMNNAVFIKGAGNSYIV